MISRPSPPRARLRSSGALFRARHPRADRHWTLKAGFRGRRTGHRTKRAADPATMSRLADRGRSRARPPRLVSRRPHPAALLHRTEHTDPKSIPPGDDADILVVPMSSTPNAPEAGTLARRIGRLARRRQPRADSSFMPHLPAIPPDVMPSCRHVGLCAGRRPSGRSCPAAAAPPAVRQPQIDHLQRPVEHACVVCIHQLARPGLRGLRQQHIGTVCSSKVQRRSPTWSPRPFRLMICGYTTAHRSAWRRPAARPTTSGSWLAKADTSSRYRLALR